MKEQVRGGLEGVGVRVGGREGEKGWRRGRKRVDEGEWENAYRAVQSNMERIAGAAREDIDIFGRGARIRRRRGSG